MDKKEAIKIGFGNHLQSLLIDKKLSLRKFATISGMEYAHIQKIRHGKVDLSLTTIFAIAEGLQISAKELFDFEIGMKK